MLARGRSVPWSYLGLGALIVLAAVLVVLALRPPTPPPPTITLTPSATESPTLTIEPGPTATPTPAPTATGEPTAAPSDVVVTEREALLDALSTQQAARAVAGACPDGGAAIELTDDGGRTWSEVDTPTDELLRIEHPAVSDIWFVGAAGPGCQPAFSISENRGQSWSAPAPADGAWHLLTDPDADGVHAPGGVVDAPCAPGRTLAIEGATFDRGSVLCEDGEVFTTLNAGQQWVSDGATPGARALALVGDRPLVAAFPVEGCAGLLVAPPGETTGACVVGASPSGVGMSVNGTQAGFLQTADGLWVSSDGGTTWTPVPAA